jgi:hypothetical protein
MQKRPSFVYVIPVEAAHISAHKDSGYSDAVLNRNTVM